MGEIFRNIIGQFLTTLTPLRHLLNSIINNALQCFNGRYYKYHCSSNLIVRDEDEYESDIVNDR
jgi:hypothetical protein